MMVIGVEPGGYPAKRLGFCEKIDSKNDWNCDLREYRKEAVSNRESLVQSSGNPEENFPEIGEEKISDAQALRTVASC
jgi:hypothetical protein